LVISFQVVAFYGKTQAALRKLDALEQCRKKRLHALVTMQLDWFHKHNTTSDVALSPYEAHLLARPAELRRHQAGLEAADKMEAAREEGRGEVNNS
jgi:hypothetical protein